MCVIVTPNNRPKLMNKPPIIIVVAAVVVIMISCIITSMTNAQLSQTSGSKFGTLASLQYGRVSYKYPELKVLWILSGAWEFKNINSSSPAFNATFNMVMFNGTSPHMHTITDFRMTSSPTNKGITTTYNGTATISFRPGFLLPVPYVTDVPISIKLMGPSAMSVWIDPTMTREHFGNTPIYGLQHGMPMMQIMSMR
jgi:hypothetical protein